MNTYKVTCEVYIDEVAKIDFIVEAEDRKSAKEKALMWDGTEVDEYNHETITRNLGDTVSVTRIRGDKDNGST